LYWLTQIGLYTLLCLYEYLLVGGADKMFVAASDEYVVNKLRTAVHVLRS